MTICSGEEQQQGEGQESDSPSLKMGRRRDTQHANTLTSAWILHAPAPALTAKDGEKDEGHRVQARV